MVSTCASKASLFQLVEHCLFEIEEVQAKCDYSQWIEAQWKANQLTTTPLFHELKFDPCLPKNLQLVHPFQVPKRGLGSIEGRVAFIHAVAHIEYMAIHLAWDAVYRFPHMPDEYYADWMNVANEEVYHFSLLQTRLQELGFNYGDFVAHDGLWYIAMETSGDLLARMALVPRGSEARGLDVTPGMIHRLEEVGDQETADLLKIIYRDEIGHVAKGSKWFRYLCDQQGLDSEQTFQRYFQQYAPGKMGGKLDHDGRKKAGFSAVEISFLEKG